MRFSSHPVEITYNTISLFQNNSFRFLGLEALWSTSNLLDKKHVYHWKTTTPLTLQAFSIAYYCNKNIDFFTRDHRLNVESSHRCYIAESCTQGRCGTLKHIDKLEAFPTNANSMPGFTFCQDSYGCVLCEDCLFFFSSRCFFRV